ncbi:fibronectin type III domain-containing protein [Lachnospiraceae bacterium 45-W7]
MTEEKFFPKHLTRTVTILALLLLLPLLSLLTGTKAQAAELKNNPTFTFTSTGGTSVSTQANSNETTVLIFGYVGCGKTRSTLNSISSCDWVKRSDIRVIFAETNGHTQEEVLAYEQGYQCPDMTFCYDEDDNIFMAMVEYAKLYGTNGGTYPMIVLIDKDNKVQNLLSGTKTANEILTEIKKFAEIDEVGDTTPPANPGSGIENINYGLNTIDGTVISTKANPNQTTVLLFGYTTCALTKSTLSNIDSSNWAARPDIRVIFAEVYGASLADTKSFAQNFSGKNIIYCHDASALNFNFAMSYLKLYNYTGGTFPYIVYIDKNNKIQNITLGPKTADEILQEIEKFAKEDETTPPPAPEPTPGETTSPSETPEPPLTISDVSGLKTASSAAKNIKLTWKKVSNANGYIVYQYSTSSKKWIEKARTNSASYTVKGLTPGTAYRFAVKAYIQSADGKQAESKSYASLNTATAPGAVKFKVTPKKKKAVITWSKVKGATGYTIYYKTNAKKPWKKLKSTKTTSYTKNKLTSGKTYIFTVKAYKTYNGKTYTSSFQSKKVKIK